MLKRLIRVCTICLLRKDPWGGVSVNCFPAALLGGILDTEPANKDSEVWKVLWGFMSKGLEWVQVHTSGLAPVNGVPLGFNREMYQCIALCMQWIRIEFHGSNSFFCFGQGSWKGHHKA